MFFRRSAPIVKAAASAAECILGGRCSLHAPAVPAVVEKLSTSITSSAESLFDAILVVLLGCVGLYKAYQKVQARHDSPVSDPTSLRRSSERSTTAKKTSLEAKQEKVKPASIKSFQLRFLPVFWLLRLAFWMAGPYFYPVYASKIINGSHPSALLISRIFLAGFGAIVLFAPLTGRGLDQYGRKRGTLAAVLLYSLGAISTKSSSLVLLFAGRAVGGIGTNLLSSAPESWLVSEAMSTGDDNDGTYLKETFGLAYAFDPLVAIVAGQIAGWCARKSGPTGPFAVMPIFLAMAGMIALVSWKENTADSLNKMDEAPKAPTDGKRSSRRASDESDISTPSLGLISDDGDSVIRDGDMPQVVEAKPAVVPMTLAEEAHNAVEVKKDHNSDGDAEKPRRNSMTAMIRTKSIKLIRRVNDESYAKSSITMEIDHLNSSVHSTRNIMGLNFEMIDGGGSEPLKRTEEHGYNPSKSIVHNIGIMKKVHAQGRMRLNLDSNKVVSPVHSTQTTDEQKSGGIENFGDHGTGLSQERRDSLMSLCSESFSFNDGPALRRGSAVSSAFEDDFPEEPFGDALAPEGAGGGVDISEELKEEKIEPTWLSRNVSTGSVPRAHVLELAKTVKMPSLNNLDIEDLDETPTVRDGLKMISIDKKLLMLGAVQSLFEGSMYIFVMQWPPAMTAAVRKYFGEDEPVPFGAVFSCFMACCMVGSTLFGKFVSRKGAKMEGLFLYMLIASAVSMAGATYGVYAGFEFFPLVLSMFAFEGCVGMYFPLIGSMRGKYLHASHRSVIMTLFSVPLNVLVVTVCLLIHHLGMIGAFGVATVALTVASACMARLIFIRRSEAKRHWGEMRRTLRRMSLVRLFLKAAKREVGSLRCSEISVRDTIRHSVTMGNQVP